MDKELSSNPRKWNVRPGEAAMGIVNPIRELVERMGKADPNQSVITLAQGVTASNQRVPHSLYTKRVLTNFHLVLTYAAAHVSRTAECCGRLQICTILTLGVITPIANMKLFTSHFKGATI